MNRINRLSRLKFRLRELHPGVFGIFADDNTCEEAPSSRAFAIVDTHDPEAAEFVQLTLAAPLLAKAAGNMLEFIDPHRANDKAYNMAVLELKRAFDFSLRELDFDRVEARENIFGMAHDKLKEHLSIKAELKNSSTSPWYKRIFK
jgi:hypothetical protein